MPLLVIRKNQLRQTHHYSKVIIHAQTMQWVLVTIAPSEAARNTSFTWRTAIWLGYNTVQNFVLDMVYTSTFTRQSQSVRQSSI